MKKIISIVGARPQFIKLAPLSKKIIRSFEEVILHTGQHYDKNMSDTFFSDLNIPLPDHNLNVNSSYHGEQTAMMIIGIEKILLKESPDLVIVFGDTNTTIAGAIAASKLQIPLVHIEAGLRSFNKSMPEEINRIVSDHISDFLFAPTETAVSNLIDENLAGKTFLSGDIMVDSLKDNLEIAINRSMIHNNLSLKKNGYFLLTLHRPYNVDSTDKLGKVLSMIGKINGEVIFPVHPRTREKIRTGEIKTPKNITLLDPVGYLDFIALENFSKKIFTDSGGIQKEAYILKKPCITIRPETEWIETVEDGWNILVDPEMEDAPDKILNFNPDRDQTERFGSDVAEKMIDKIKSII